METTAYRDYSWRLNQRNMEEILRKFKQVWVVSMISDHRYRLLLIETTHGDYPYGDYYYWLWRPPNPGFDALTKRGIPEVDPAAEAEAETGLGDVWE
eukprot:gene9577-biopygen7663